MAKSGITLTLIWIWRNKSEKYLMKPLFRLQLCCFHLSKCFSAHVSMILGTLTLF